MNTIVITEISSITVGRKVGHWVGREVGNRVGRIVGNTVGRVVGHRVGSGLIENTVIIS